MMEEKYADIVLCLIVAFHGALVLGFALITLWKDTIAFQIDRYVFGEDNQFTQHDVAKIGCRFMWYSLIYPFIFFKMEKISYKIGMFFYFYLCWLFLISAIVIVIEKYF
ncbi:hypothetical protein [Vibrio rumoiensis]|uniref:hypothetical protein n=1 Tax=Vibrio rumoiensis TaxID=76258 RepID=UPI003AA967EB